MSNYPNRMFRPSRYVRLLISLVLVIGLVIFAVFSQTSLFDETKKTAALNPKKISQQFFRSLRLDGSLPICDKGLLEISNYPQTSCQVKWYGKRDTAECLDAISGRTGDGNAASSRKFLHFVFLGDSRIRQHFYNFLKLIADYDLEFGMLLEDYRLHQNLNVTSQILNLCVSFYWEPLLENSVSIHHIRLEDQGNGYEPYRQKLTELEPILRRITRRSTVIWLNQYSVIDDPFTAFVIHEHISNIVSIRVSIHQYNLLAENILRHSGVIVWNTGSLLTDEYIRGCYIQIRDDIEYQPTKGYFTCSDLLHPGFVVTSQAIQLIFNEICNGLMGCWSKNLAKGKSGRQAGQSGGCGQIGYSPRAGRIIHRVRSQSRRHSEGNDNIPVWNGVSLASTGSCRCEHGLGKAGDYGGSCDGRRRRCVRSARAGESQRAQDNAGQVVESESSRFWLLKSLVKIADGGSLLIALFNLVLFCEWRK
ncbi:hypothetical protein DAPPUDRAFT_112081 [Daphnia pulex]|uniref:Uncharacterized protein n=1 Tax=Daphnia pulex TaxID=6669 RepID=E9HAX1_DAPPU|nr:hypothetical protein DAPPUDRAFT_112081 [Daphnia pulex]|eukprot:EFX71107.1 hypothetical protein DAPPUDRAFT_112081 [Daphnia pulex]